MTRLTLVIEDLAIDELEQQEELARKTSSSHMLAFDIEESSDDQNEDQIKTPEEAEVAAECLNIALLSDETAEASKWFNLLGLTYSTSVIKNTPAAVVKLSLILIKFFFTGLKDFKAYIEKTFKVYEELQHEIAVLHNSVKDLTKDQADGSFAELKVLNYLKISESLDVKSNNKILQDFLQTFSNCVLKAVVSDHVSITKLTENVKYAEGIKASEILSFSDFNSVMETPDNQFDFKSKSEYQRLLVSKVTIPGDVKLLMCLAKDGLSDDLALKFYQQSYSSLVLNSKSLRNLDEIKYLSKNELQIYLDGLNKMVLSCIEQKKSFEQILLSKLKLRDIFKSYLSKLFNSDEDLNLKSSLLELTYVKIWFVEKMYIQSYVDMHDFTIRVLKANIQFAQSNLKHLK